MGEVAELMNSGVLCKLCGVPLSEDPTQTAPGYPITCADCRGENHEH